VTNLPLLLLVHGSAADRSTFSIQLRALADRFRVVAPVRRQDAIRVEEHAADLAAIVEREGGQALAVGSSFGAVCVLELARSRPELVSGAVLCEPPLAPADRVPAVPAGFGCAFDALVAARGGEAAAEMFLRVVLTDAVYERMPGRYQERSKALWRQIRADSLALSAYQVGYDRLARELRCPVLLLGGERSPPLYRPTLEALAAAIPESRLAFLRGAGHMMHAEAFRQFHEELDRLAATIARTSQGGIRSS
jgi:pimeloyl-ACP methyl ester carboxylesterase